MFRPLALALASTLVIAACTTMTPARVEIAAPKDETFVDVRRALVAEGLQPILQDTEAGTVASDWVVFSANDDSTWVYRLVAIVDGTESRATVVVRAEMQTCPPYATVFDRCQAYPGKVIPKLVQRKIDAVGARVDG